MSTHRPSLRHSAYGIPADRNSYLAISSADEGYSPQRSSSGQDEFAQGQPGFLGPEFEQQLDLPDDDDDYGDDDNNDGCDSGGGNAEVAEDSDGWEDSDWDFDAPKFYDFEYPKTPGKASDRWFDARRATPAVRRTKAHEAIDGEAEDSWDDEEDTGNSEHKILGNQSVCSGDGSTRSTQEDAYVVASPTPISVENLAFSGGE
ncbi:hypothetical protein EV182_005077, partial [Spiromyces aspiralis]